MRGFGKTLDPSLRLSVHAHTRVSVRVCRSLDVLLPASVSISRAFWDGDGLPRSVHVLPLGLMHTGRGFGWWSGEAKLPLSSWLHLREKVAAATVHAFNAYRASMLPQIPFLERSLVATGTLQGEASGAQWHVGGFWVNTVKGGSALDRPVQLEQSLWTGGVLVQVSWAGVRWAAVGPFRVDSPAARPELLEGCAGSSSWPWGRDGSGRSVLRAHGGS